MKDSELTVFIYKHKMFGMKPQKITFLNCLADTEENEGYSSTLR